MMHDGPNSASPGVGPYHRDTTCFFSIIYQQAARSRFSPQKNMQTSEDAAPSLVSDMTDMTSASTPTRFARTKTPNTIQNYFKPVSPSDNLDMDAISCPTDSDMPSSNPSLQAPEQKKYKITAYNGLASSLRQPEKKKIKREVTLEYPETGSQASRRRKTRAKLANLPDLPLDVLFEIFCHLLPLDILHLARTTKALRFTLLHRSATSVWKASLLNVPNLPRCPQDLSLPFYVNLVFDSHCHNCLTNNIGKVDFYLRVRYCSKCAKSKLVPVIEPKDQKLADELLRLVERLLPSSCVYTSIGIPLCTAAAKAAFFKDFMQMTGSDIRKQKEKAKSRKRHAYLCSSWKLAQDKKRTKEISSIKATRNKMIRANLTELGYKAELNYLDGLARYICAIYPRPSIHLFYKHPDVNQSKPLTDRVWSNIKPSMIEYMEEASVLVAQDARIKLLRKRRAVVHAAYVKWRMQPSRLKQYPSNLLMPGPADIMVWSPMKTLINKNGIGELDMEEVEEEFEYFGYSGYSRLNNFITTWREDHLEDLWYKIANTNLWESNPSIRYSIRHVSYHLPKFELAAVVFRCGDYHWGLEDKWAANEDIPLDANGRNTLEERDMYMWYPEYIFHPCNSIKRVPYPETVAGVEYPTLSVSKEYKGFRRCEWTSEHLHFDERASRTVKNILEACGLDWEKTTAGDMDKRDDKFVCLKCTFGATCDGERKVRVWSWRDAVQHSLKTHFGDARVKWEQISPPDTIRAKALEIIQCSERGYILPDSERLWKCMVCRDTESERGRMSWDELQDHFIDTASHKDGSVAKDLNGMEEKLYYKALDYAPRALPPIKMSPRKVQTDV